MTDRRSEHRGTPDRRRDDAEREERVRWCQAQTLGHWRAHFGPGDRIRCPGTKWLPNSGDVVCGMPFGHVLPGTMLEVRVRHARLPAPRLPGTAARCPNCKRELEFLTVAAQAA
jgi:hypothetical protein